MGFAANGCRRAVYATPGQGLEAALNWVLEHMGDADFDAPYEAPGVSAPAPTSAPALGGQAAVHTAVNEDAVAMIESMGFSRAQAVLGARTVPPPAKFCAMPEKKHSPNRWDGSAGRSSCPSYAALASTGNDVERAADWIFSHADELDQLVAAAAASASSGTATASAAAPTPSAVAAEPASLSDGPSRYRLAAFVSHMGTSTASGHYVAHIRKGGRWVFFNDAKVALSEDTPKEMGYLYVFARADMPEL